MPKLTSLDRDTQFSRREMVTQMVAEGRLHLPEGIKEIRLALGLSQESFADRFKLTRNQLIELEKGRANPTLETLERIGKPFGFTVGFIPMAQVKPPPESLRRDRPDPFDLDQ